MRQRINLDVTSANTATVTLNGNTYFFSYKTCIAFATPDLGMVVSENQWTVTTGRHLTQLDGGSKEAKAKRLKADAFNQLLAKHIDQY